MCAFVKIENQPNQAPLKANIDYEVAIIGAGISGIGAAILLKKEGITAFRLFEQSHDLAGTWRDNTYPGVAVDIPSFSYSFSFEPNPYWSKLFASGAEIRQYIEHCANKYEIRPHIQFNSSVEKIVFDEKRHCWEVFLKGGEKVLARYVISATGLFATPFIPPIEGLQDFEGKMMHTASWDTEYDYQGKKVGMIGTGSSAVQLLPAIESEVESINVFQRTPIWVLPKSDPDISPKFHKIFEKAPLLQRSLRLMMDARLELLTFITLNYHVLGFLNTMTEKWSLRYLKKEIKDPELLEKLTPQYGFSCKRPAVSNDYWQTFNKAHVQLVTEGIERVIPQGVLTKDGKEHELEALFFATGFNRERYNNGPTYEVYGLNKMELTDFWEENRYQAYHGVSVPQFPNYFMTAGPYSGSFNWFSMLEANLKHILRCLKQANKKKATYIEIKEAEHQAHFEKMIKKSKNMVYSSSICGTTTNYYVDKHGDISVPSPVIPLVKWFQERFSDMSVYRFES